MGVKMVSYFVRYRGAAENPEAFVSYYRAQHAQILKKFPGIRSLVLHTLAAFKDPFPVMPAGSCLLAQMVFDDPAALQRALVSPARREAREDFSRFPRFLGEVTHEALAQEVIF